MLGVFLVILIHSAPFDEVAQGPKVPKKDKEISLKEGKTVVVSEILFYGNQKISTKELQNQTRYFLHRPIAESDLYDLKQTILSLYQEKGIEGVEIQIPAKQKRGVLNIYIQEKISPRK